MKLRPKGNELLVFEKGVFQELAGTNMKIMYLGAMPLGDDYSGSNEGETNQLTAFREMTILIKVRVGVEESHTLTFHAKRTSVKKSNPSQWNWLIDGVGPGNVLTVAQTATKKHHFAFKYITWSMLTLVPGEAIED